jgi:hypothetical protein
LIIIKAKELIKKLQERVETLTYNNKVFGVPLAKVLEREKPADGIPYIVKSIIEFLRPSTILITLFLTI